MEYQSLQEMVQQYLKDNLSIEVEDGDWTIPNHRSVKLILEGEVISATSFDVVQQREYEG